MPEDEPASTEDRPKVRYPWWLWPNLLSLDAPIVAVSWLYLLSKSFRTFVLGHTYWILGLAVWLIYTADHLWDGRRLRNRNTATPRHRFAADFFLPLSLLWLVGLAALVYFLLYRAEEVLVFSPHSFFLGLLVAVYFGGRCFNVHDFPKEVMCGTIFALGVLCPISALSNWLHWTDYVRPEIWLFALLCSVNCIAISWWERDADRDNDPSSAGVKHPHEAWPHLALFVAFLSLAFAFADLSSTSVFVLAAIALSSILLVLLARTGSRLSVPLKRVLADLALLSPWVFAGFV